MQKRENHTLVKKKDLEKIGLSPHPLKFDDFVARCPEKLELRDGYMGQSKQDAKQLLAMSLQSFGFDCTDGLNAYLVHAANGFCFEQFHLSQNTYKTHKGTNIDKEITLWALFHTWKIVKTDLMDRAWVNMSAQILRKFS